MNVALVYFSYSGDEVLLNEAVKAVPRLREQGHEVDFYVVDDAKSPLDMPPVGCRYWRSEWDRKGNLNGAECVCGMVDEYNAIFNMGLYEWVVKVDCDTFVNGLDWLQGVSNREVAFAGTVHVQDYCSGSCYAVSRAGVELLQERLSEASWRGAAERGYCEDKVLFNICRMSGLRVHALRADGVTDGKLWHDWQGEPVAFEELTRAYAVDFKACRWNSKPEAWQMDKVRGLERLRGYTKFLGC